MGELGGAVEYLYWSQRRAEKFLSDNGIERPPVTRTIATPAISIAPVFSRSSTQQGGSRSQIAELIESSLGQSAVTRFDAPRPIRYAKGLGSIVFGEFIAKEDAGERKPLTGSPAVIFTSVSYGTQSQDSIAICLFGSMDNFADRIQAAGPNFDSGWTSSAAPQVFRFLRAQCKQQEYLLTPQVLAVEALRIALLQGMDGDDGEGPRPAGLDRPWYRAFTYGDVQDTAEWLAQIYLDVDITKVENPMDNDRWSFRRVLIGAPFWIRTPKPQALRLYAELPPKSRPRPRHAAPGQRLPIMSRSRVKDGEVIPCDSAGYYSGTD